jgi:hypothetical protein
MTDGTASAPSSSLAGGITVKADVERLLTSPSRPTWSAC